MRWLIRFDWSCGRRRSVGGRSDHHVAGPVLLDESVDSAAAALVILRRATLAYSGLSSKPVKRRPKRLAGGSAANYAASLPFDLLSAARSAVVKRWFAISTYFEFNSNPMKRRPSRLATTAVVPAPMNGSRTMPGSKPCLHLQPNTSCVLLVSAPVRCNLSPACLLAASRLLAIDLECVGVPQRLQTFSGQPARMGRSQSCSE